MRAIFDTDPVKHPGTDTNLMLFSRKYLYEATGRTLQAGTYSVEIDDPDQAGTVSAAIDALFENSDAQTRTETEKAFAASFVAMAGNLALLLNGIGIAVTFTILLVVANTMSIAVRERRKEIGVLKTLGFTSRQVMGLVVAESVLIALIGGALGVLGSQGHSAGSLTHAPGMKSLVATVGLSELRIPPAGGGARLRERRLPRLRRRLRARLLRLPRAHHRHAEDGLTMALPLYYNVRNVRVRWQLTLLAVGGIALVVAVFAVLMSMSEGFAAALRTTGRTDNAIVFQRGSGSELTSSVPLADRNMITVDDRVARDASGQPLASWELVVVIGLPRASDGQPANVTLRAVTPRAFEVRGRDQRRRGAHLHAGARRGDRREEAHEAHQGAGDRRQRQVPAEALQDRGGLRVDGRRLRERGLGRLRHLRRHLPAGSGQQLPRRAHEGPGHDPRARPLDPRPAADAAAGAVGEAVLRGAGGAARAGACRGSRPSWPSSWASEPCSAPSTRCTPSWAPAPARSAPCAPSASRAASILVSFLIESVILAAIGGAIGCLLAFPMNGFSTGTGQTQSFSEIAFAFRITPGIVMTGMAFAVVMGVLGRPAARAARRAAAHHLGAEGGIAPGCAALRARSGSRASVKAVPGRPR